MEIYESGDVFQRGHFVKRCKNKSKEMRVCEKGRRVCEKEDNNMSEWANKGEKGQKEMF